MQTGFRRLVADPAMAAAAAPARHLGADHPSRRQDRRAARQRRQVYAVCVRRPLCRREDLLDTSFCLRRPSDHSATEGARFEVHIEKARGIHGELVLPFEARLETRDGKAAWSMKDVEDRLRVAALLATGMTVREIAEEIGIGKSVVHQMKQRIGREAKEAAADQDEGE